MKYFWAYLFIFFYLIPEQVISNNWKVEPFFKINTVNLDKFFFSLKTSCKKKFYLNLEKKPSYPLFGSIETWKSLCLKIEKESVFNISFLSENFYLLSNIKKPGLLTGYYEPIIEISRERNSEFKFPILKKSKNLNGERKVILKSYNDKEVLFWTNNNIDLFFLHIQGSGIGVLNNGEKKKIAYSGNNGFEYTSIGKVLINMGEIRSKDVSLKSIKEWLNKNQDKSEDVFNSNKRFIFFKDGGDSESYSKGAMSLELVPYVSLAIDASIYPFGFPFLMKTDSFNYNRPVIAHDTGSAIRGHNRADLFIGRGKEAETIAGFLKKDLKLFLLIPNSK